MEASSLQQEKDIDITDGTEDESQLSRQHARTSKVAIESRGCGALIDAQWRAGLYSWRSIRKYTSKPQIYDGEMSGLLHSELALWHSR